MGALEQEAQREITSSFSGEEGTLRYGRISGLCGAKWESLMEQYAREYPLISFKSIEADQSSLLKMLVNGLIEVAVLYSDRNIPDTGKHQPLATAVEKPGAKALLHRFKLIA